MTAQTSIPLKWYVPFANGDSSRVELPVTTADPTRASQTLGFPPLTMQPPESGGVPPQGEDFNGGMNQVARICWWVLNGGGWPYDSTFATNSNINGYPNGAKLQSADFKGDWISIADNNQNNPDTVSTGWVPGFQYGTTAVTGLTGGTTTLTPAQAAKGSITLAGTLGSAQTIVLPTWTKNWTITNNTTGAFVTIVKTAAGSGVTIPQNGSPTRVAGDGTNITQAAENIAAATSPTHATPMSQAAGVAGNVRNLVMSVAAASATATLTADEIIVETSLGGTRYCLGSFSQSINLATTGAGGMDTGAAPVSGAVAIYAFYNPTTGARALVGVNATAATAPTIYGGANAPSGYTASALVSVWPTNGSSLLVIGYQEDRNVALVNTTGATFTTAQTNTSVSLATTIPRNAKRVLITQNQTTATSATSFSLTLSGGSIAGAAGIGAQTCNLGTTGQQQFESTVELPLLTPQTIFVTWVVTGGSSPTLTLYVTRYTI